MSETGRIDAYVYEYNLFQPVSLSALLGPPLVQGRLPFARYARGAYLGTLIVFQPDLAIRCLDSLSFRSSFLTFRSTAAVVRLVQGQAIEFGFAQPLVDQVVHVT